MVELNVRKFVGGLTLEQQIALREWFLLQDDISEVKAVYESGTDECHMAIPEEDFERIAQRKRTLQNNELLEWDEAARDALEEYFASGDTLYE